MGGRKGVESDGRGSGEEWREEKRSSCILCEKKKFSIKKQKNYMEKRSPFLDSWPLSRFG